MERALIIGAAGFVGGYLAKHLKTAYGMEVSVTKLPHETLEIEGADVFDLDILKKEVGIVFAQVLEHAGVYKCTGEGRAAFLRFIETVK